MTNRATNSKLPSMTKAQRAAYALLRPYGRHVVTTPAAIAVYEELVSLGWAERSEGMMAGVHAYCSAPVAL